MELDELNIDAGTPDTHDQDTDTNTPPVEEPTVTEPTDPEGDSLANTLTGTTTKEEPTNTDETPTSEPPAEKPVDDVPADIDAEKLSGIERYLSQFDIEGGMVSFEDGSKQHFNELKPEKQVEVLSQLHDSSTKGIEDKYGLDENEIGLVNYLRQQDKTIDEVIDELASQRAQTYITSQQVQGMDIEKMDNDAVYTAALLKSNPEATAEQIEKDLETAKKMSNFDNMVGNIRQGFEQERTQFLAQEKDKAYKESYQEIEDQRKQVVDVVSSMKEIDGLTINDGIKNDVLDLILNVDEDGDSTFMTDVFSNPERLFRAAFWYKNGTDIVKSREDYWKKEKSAAYKRGLEDAGKGRQSFVASDVKDNKTAPHYGDSGETISLDDLYINS